MNVKRLKGETMRNNLNRLQSLMQFKVISFVIPAIIIAIFCNECKQMILTNQKIKQKG